MGKTKKAHRKKVAVRNQKIKQAQVAYERWVDQIMNAPAQPNPQPSNFITITGQ